MKPKHLILSLGLLAGLTLSPLAAQQNAQGGGPVEVTFQEPENFTDMARSFSALDKADPGYMRELRSYIERKAGKQLASGQRLSVTITDVDMAGEFEPQRGPSFNDVRIVKEIYRPRIELQFSLTDATGNVVASGQRSLTDLSFSQSVTPIRNDDPLRYEKELVDDFVRSLRKVK